MHKFINNKLCAPNVIEVDVDISIIQEFLRILCDGSIQKDYFVTSPNWNSDIAWISPNTIEAFHYFHSRFLRLKLHEHVLSVLDIEETARMYSGFLVTRSICHKPDFHVDWIDTNNEAFTVLSPLTSSSEGFGLLYKTLDNNIAEYSYQLGKALIFGDDFIHSTQPGQSSQPVALLSFTFGTDKMIHWQKIAQTAAGQGNLLRRPDGSFLILDFDKY